MSDTKELTQSDIRSNKIVKTSIVGIITNVLLAAFKVFVGLVTNSIAITLDAVNNLSDALSSIITIIGAKLGNKQADKKHPFGYGRIEYMSTLTIGMIILYAGIKALEESIKSIITPEPASYTTISVVIVAVAVVVKVVLGTYFISSGKKVDSDALIASGKDARMDSIVSAATVLAAIVFMTTGLALEAYLAALISLLMIKAGLETLKDTVSQILGERVENTTAAQIKKTACSVAGVRGAYDLVVTDFGPGKVIASIHVEVDDTSSADDIDTITRHVQEKIYSEHGIAITAVGIYSVNTGDNEASHIRENIRKMVLEDKDILQMHGFYINMTEKTIRFDLVVGYSAANRRQTHTCAVAKVKAAYPDYKVYSNMDADTSD